MSMKHTARKYNKGKFEIVELSNADTVARIVLNLGNTLFSFKKGDREVLYFPFSFEEYQQTDKLAGVPFLHPWANRLDGDYITIDQNKYPFPEENISLIYRDWNGWPLHGLIMKSDKWQTSAISENEDSCLHKAEFLFDDEKLLSIFPFVHAVHITHSLKGNKLSIETTVINKDDKAMPVSFGYHPYFLIDVNAENSVEIPAKKIVDVDDKLIPTGTTSVKERKWKFDGDEVMLKGNQFDDCFFDLNYDNEGRAHFKLNDVHIAQDQNYPFNQIYYPDDVQKPYICIEPMTATINALNHNACPLIAPGETFTAAFSIRL
jgi:aldose 1-epimerase